ncbi:PIG-L deacetylase family protein [Corallococcus sp. Z5C101001]|uniref:PIG-L deacetylase family protein n=1 Tax=Corallococcus sp. Z5C101001 TaxID=2596829 RepID=UPI00163D4798|nr:PIG-L family deacetylase [Corallococcus sp. Z5C101001]
MSERAWRRRDEGGPEHVFFSPHPDDVALGAYASLLGVPRGVVPTLVTVFSQSCWEFELPVDPSRALQVSSLRMGEDRRFARAHGADLVHLGFRDTSLRSPPGGAPEPEEALAALATRLRLALEEVLACVSPEAVCYVPLGISSHVDHLLVRDAVRALRGDRGVVYYEDLPYSAHPPEDEIVDYAWALGLSPRCLDVTALWPAKLRGLSFYASQLEPLTLPAVEAHARRLGAGRGLCERVWTVAP